MAMAKNMLDTSNPLVMHDLLGEIASLLYTEDLAHLAQVSKFHKVEVTRLLYRHITISHTRIHSLALVLSFTFEHFQTYKVLGFKHQAVQLHTDLISILGALAEHQQLITLRWYAKHVWAAFHSVLGSLKELDIQFIRDGTPIWSSISWTPLPKLRKICIHFDDAGGSRDPVTSIETLLHNTTGLEELAFVYGRNMGGTTHLNALGATHPGLRRFSMHNPHSSSVDLNSQKPADFLIRHPLLQPLITGMVHSISLSESALIHSPEVFCYPITNLRLVSPSVTSSTTIINAFLEDFLLDQTLVAIFQAAPGLKEYTIIEENLCIYCIRTENALQASGKYILFPIQTQTLLPAIPPDSPLRALRLGSDFDWQTWKGDRAVFKNKIPGGARDILPVSLQENLGNIPPTFRYLGWEVAGSPPLIYVINGLGGIERVSQILKRPELGNNWEHNSILEYMKESWSD
ncbi:hypothetical protein B0H14DRAFT_2601035 [Mycena olivaceomarginata]|nr:hypothetical protein B0H14DRAFT_2601035 [Mycena olivaceomarginata]